jgi:hypothetical protein
MGNSPKRVKTTETRHFRLTKEGDYYLEQVAKYKGLSLTGLIEMTVRDLAREAGIRPYEEENMRSTAQEGVQAA